MEVRISYFVLVVVCSFQLALTESGFFWHVTDFHYDPTYWTTQLSCNDDVPNPGTYGDYWCDSNWRLVEDSITNMARIKPDVDFIIWTGDTVAHIPDDNLSLAANLDVLQNVTNAFNIRFGRGVKFLPSLGNHDFYPSNQADVKQDEMYNKTAGIWSTWITDPDQLQQFMKGGFFTMSLNSKVRLLSLNTNLYFNHNRITKTMSDPAGQFAWMEKVLAKAKDDGEKVIVAAHVAPGVVTPKLTDWMYPDHQKRYVGILTKYFDIILASHYGHDHSDGFKIVQDEKDESKALPQFVAPSVTPCRFEAGVLYGKPHNPGIRLVEYDKATGTHINYVQYFINLTDANINNHSIWTKLYDFKDAYNVNDMSVRSLRNIFNEMKKDGGEDLAQIYCNNIVVGAENKTCTKENRFAIICGGLQYKIDDAHRCVDKLLIGASSFIRLHFACAIVSVLFIATMYL